MNKLFKFAALILMPFTVLTGCENNVVSDSESAEAQINEQIERVYKLAQQNGYTGTYDEWLESIKGEDGKGIESISLSSSIDGVDTYTVTYTDSTEYTFTIKNGKDGENGKNGISILSVEKTYSEGLVDTYTITYSDKTTSTFKVTNGEKGSQGVQGIQGEPGKDGKTPTITIGSNGNWYVDGVDSKQPSALKGDTGNGITEIKLTSQNDNVDIYTITYTDGNETTFTVTNGKDGEGSTSISDTGTLIINDIDTGIIIDYSKVDDRKLTLEQQIMQNGLVYETRTINGKTGYVVSDYEYYEMDYDYAFDFFKYRDDYTIEEFENLIDNIESYEVDIVVPNYIGSVPVIGINNCFKNTNIRKISLSKNTTYIQMEAFESCEKLESIDFNGCQIEYIPMDCFNGDELLKEINLPSSVYYLGNNAFYNCPLNDFDFTNIKYIGSYCFNALQKNIYLTKNVEYIGSNAFCYGYLYLEHEKIPSTWGSNINGTEKLYCTPVTNCKINDEYIYSINENDKVTVCQYLGDEKKLTIPAKIDDIDVDTVGYGFNSCLWYDWEDYYEAGINFDCKCLNEVIIPSTIKTIEYGALICPDTYIYVEKGVENVWAGIGCDADMEFKFRMVVYEDPSDISFKYQNSTYDYDTYVDLDEGILFRTYSKLDYSKIYYDESTKTYYYNEGLYYSVMACIDHFGSEIIIPDKINELPVKQINKYAYDLLKANKITIGSNVRKIKTGAFFGMYGWSGEDVLRIFVPDTVEIINAYGFTKDSSVIFYIESSEKPEDWDTNWASGSKNIYYSQALSDFEKMHYYGNFQYEIKNDEIILVKCKSTSSVKIPRSIDNIPVTTIKQGFYSYSSSANIYIPLSITTIEEKAFTNTYCNGFNFYFESASLADNVSTNYYYSSYYSSNSSGKYEYFSRSLGY